MKLNLQHLIAISGLMLVCGLGVVHAQVDVTFTAVDESDTIPLVYLTGDMNGWAWDAMYDDGTHGDLVAGDHTWTLTVTGVNTGSYSWGLASDANSWLISSSSLIFEIGENGSVSGDTVYIMHFSDMMVDVTCTLTDITENLADVQFTGWVNGWVYEPMYDDGTNGDETAGDHTWSLTVTHRADHDYDWGAAEGGTQWLIAAGSTPVVKIDSFGNVSGQADYTFGGADVTILAVDESDTISQLYVTGAMNSWASDMLYDDGTNGDEVAGDHIWSRAYSNLPEGDYQWGLSSDYNTWLISGHAPSFTVDNTFSVTGETTYFLTYSDIMVDVTCTLIDITEKLEDVQFTGWVNGWVYEPMYDDGTNGDETAGDHTWSLTVTHRADRDYEWGAAEGGTQWLITGSTPVVNVDSLGNVSGQADYKYGGANVTILAVDESDTISQLYVTGGMNSWGSDMLYDDGTNGDEVAGDHIWSRTYSNLPAGDYDWGLSSDYNTWLISGPTPSFSVDSTFNVTGVTSYILTYSDIMVDIVVTLVDNTQSLVDVQFTGWVNGWVYELMYDDGTNGDETAGDHTWSLTVTHRADRDYDWGAAEGGTQWLITGATPNIVIDSLGIVSGDTTYSYGTTSIPKTMEQGFIIYPNPVRSILYIEADYEVDRVMITNIIGQVVSQYGDVRKDLIQIDVNNLPNGIYFISTYGTDGRFDLLKFMKN